MNKRDELVAEVDRLRKDAHDAPLAQIYTDHRGNKSIGVHTQAWARSSRAYGEALKRLRDFDEGQG